MDQEILTSSEVQSVIEYYDGNKFTDTNAKYYDGSKFVDCDVYYFDGTKFIKI